MDCLSLNEGVERTDFTRRCETDDREDKILHESASEVGMIIGVSSWEWNVVQGEFSSHSQGSYIDQNHSRSSPRSNQKEMFHGQEYEMDRVSLVGARRPALSGIESRENKPRGTQG